MRSKILVAAAVVALGFFAIASGSALAAPGGKGGKPSGGGASIVLNQTDPHFGDRVTFTTSGGSRITVACYQGGIGDMVWSADQAVGTSFLLGSAPSIWASRGGGPALCYAWLYKRSLSTGVLAYISFNAGG